ncbi:hypothetical protein [Methylobacterium iners]|uniref:Uncharacterized protein n=1 Tax=Methylobacterium iners TaxID=418707 RepID=A0ABQ4RQ90_9HYPH|nr:hypothetical protein [Methylobacterium iners]GJD92930.1 hypothetical protein OCOJLMKI_0113 [Methylobacterium iners]
MPYSLANPPTQRHQDIGNRGPAEWALDGSDAPSVVAVTGYISNARDLGMKAGDVVRYRQNSTPPVLHLFYVASITAAGAADLTDGAAQPAANAT